MESPILLELQSDLPLLLEQKGGSVEDGSLVANNLCMTLESGFRHGLIRESRESTDFFDVVLVLFDQQNTYGSKTTNNRNVEHDTNFKSVIQRTQRLRVCPANQHLQINQLCLWRQMPLLIKGQRPTSPQVRPEWKMAF